MPSPIKEQATLTYEVKGLLEVLLEVLVSGV
jgi:hypothetical protein